MINSVYTPLDREILLRLQSEAVTLATLFDKQLESLGRRAEDFSSDGFIRTQTKMLVSTTSSHISHPAYEKLEQHLRLNKLPIVQEFVDLHIYDLDKTKIIGLGTVSSDAQSTIIRELHPGNQHFSGIISPDNVTAFPMAAIITPLYDIQHEKQIGYLVCIFDLVLVIEHASMKFDDTVPESYNEKYLTFVDQHGLKMEIPWWYLKTRQGNTALGDERVGVKISPMQTTKPSAKQNRQNPSQPGGEIFRQSYLLQSTGWSTIIELNVTHAMNPLVVMESKALGIAGVMAAATLIVLFVVIQYIVRPLGELQRMAHRIKEGDFSARNTIDTEDEIGMLAKISNLMAEAIEDHTKNLEQSTADLQKRERELRIQHRLLDTVIHSMSDGLILMNFQGQVMLSNKAAEPLLDILHQTECRIDIQKCESHKENSEQCITCMCDPNLPTSCVLTVSDTIYEILSTKVQTLHGSSKVLVMRNITERELMHRRQAHQERLTVLGKIAAVVAHEMNNPLAAISMYNQMMEAEMPKDFPFCEHIDVIKRNTESCQRIITNLLEYVRTPQPQIREIDLHTLLGNVTQFVRPLHQEAPVSIEPDFQAQNGICWGDATQLQQVFVNLLANAIQAIYDSRGVIRLRTLERNNGEELVVDVEDTGSGIDVVHIPDIFEPFFTTKSSGGTGLGLSTSRRIIEAHGGELDLVETHPGKTIFRVVLPRARKHINGSFIPIEMSEHS
ncbi:MAG: HAMP domain-containing protein [Candidatus Latescibacteria bacterium]|nr:HAMP domain-containing protein [Candidatus Latescibacterota bacterium]